MKPKEKLETFYTNVLVPIIEPMEKYRTESSKKLKRYLFNALICFPLVTFGFLIVHPIVFLLVLIPTFIFLGLAYQKLLEMNKKLRYAFKYKVLSKTIEHLFDQFEYIANQRIAKSVLFKSMLFPSYITGVKGEDFMRFKIGDAYIMFCETKVFRSREKLMFKGIFISCSFNKYFKSKTLVISNRASSYLLRIKRQLFNKMQRVNLESPDFERNFNVVSEDQIEARYILTPRLMERMLKYKLKTGKNLSVSFIDNRLYCAVPNFNNLFEVPFFKPIDFECIIKTLEPVILYTDIVEDLNLNLKIWSKK